MKRTLSMFLALAVFGSVVLTSVGCGDQPNDSNNMNVADKTKDITNKKLGDVGKGNE